jgi:aminomethyltransferase
MVDFAGWEMPVQYPSGTLAEHRTVRRASGLFDVSHMGRIEVVGPGSGKLVDRLVTSDVLGLKVGRARYGLICAEDGGILDDVVTMRLDDTVYTIVCNAASWDRVFAWIVDHATEEHETVTVTPRRDDTAMIAVQGPSAGSAMRSICGEGAGIEALRRFGVMTTPIDGVGSAIISKTGYTGEDGYELIVDASVASSVWDRLLDNGSLPCGLGARDTLRLEAGFLLYGQDMDSGTTPLEAGLDRFVDLEKDFIGAGALRLQEGTGIERRLVGFVTEGRAAPRHGYEIRAKETVEVLGVVTSGGPSPTLGLGIGLAYLPADRAKPGTSIQVDIRSKITKAEVVEIPFYRRTT